MAWAGHAAAQRRDRGVYAGLIDGLVADEPTTQIPTLETDVLLSTPAERRRVAERTLAFALALG